MNQDAIKSLKAAEAEIQLEDYSGPTLIDLEKRKVSDELTQLRWAWGLMRLNLAATGITDAGLDQVGLCTIDWQFTTHDARIRLKKLYPSIQD